MRYIRYVYGEYTYEMYTCEYAQYISHVHVHTAWIYAKYIFIRSPQAKYRWSLYKARARENNSRTKNSN